MKILFTADLHLNIPSRSQRTGRTAFDVFAGMVEMENPEVVVVAGDIRCVRVTGMRCRAADLSYYGSAYMRGGTRVYSLLSA